MKKLIRSRKGFTLAEMVLVIAIIVILAGAAAVGVVEKINRANQNAEAVRLHAAGGHFWTVEGGHVVELDPNDYDPNNPNHRSGGAMDMQYDEVKYIQGTVPQHAPQTYNPGGGDPIGPGTGGSGSGGSSSAGHHTQSASDMLKDFLDHYGIPYTENGGTITWDHDGDYGGQGFSDAWNQWKKDHANSTGSGSSGGSSSGGNNVSTGGSGSGSSGSGSGSTGGSGSGNGSSSTGGSSSSSGGNTGTVVTVPNTVSSGKGVYSYSESNGTATISLGDSQWNTVGFTLTKDGDNYIMAPASTGNAGSGWYTLPDNLFPARDQKKPYTLNPQQKAWLEGYGITFN